MIRSILPVLSILLIFFTGCGNDRLLDLSDGLDGTFRISQVENQSFVDGKPVVSLSYQNRGTISLGPDGTGMAVIDGSRSEFNWKKAGELIIISHPVADLVFKLEKNDGQLVLVKEHQQVRDGISYLDLTRWTLEKMG